MGPPSWRPLRSIWQAFRRAQQRHHGRELQARDFHLIQGVGAGSPGRRGLESTFAGDRPRAKKIKLLVRNGVCFDTGGWTSSRPRHAADEERHGGAACTLGLAQMLMQLDAPVQLRVLIPAVETASMAILTARAMCCAPQGAECRDWHTDAEGGWFSPMRSRSGC